MSFGSAMGHVLTNELRADLIINDAETIPINFDSFSLTYKKNAPFSIRLGLLSDPGSKNELTLRGAVLEPGMTYPISPMFQGVAAGFALEGYTQALPAAYSGMLNVDAIVTGEDGATTVSGSFSIYFQDATGKDFEVKCTKIRLFT
ncbi:hypothetical protein [Pseudomonas graminis]